MDTVADHVRGFCRCKRLLLALGLAIVLTPGASAHAVTVHTWLDRDGQRHYGDQRPDGPAGADAEQIEFADEPLLLADAAAADYYSITNQWARLRAERDAAAARSIERGKLRVEQRKAATNVALENARYEDGSYAFRPIYRHGYSPRSSFGDERGFGRDRRSYLSSKRRQAFIPYATPAWPRLR